MGPVLRRSQVIPGCVPAGAHAAGTQPHPSPRSMHAIHTHRRSPRRRHRFVDDGHQGDRRRRRGKRPRARQARHRPALARAGVRRARPAPVVDLHPRRHRRSPRRPDPGREGARGRARHHAPARVLRAVHRRRHAAAQRHPVARHPRRRPSPALRHPRDPRTVRASGGRHARPVQDGLAQGARAGVAARRRQGDHRLGLHRLLPDWLVG